MKKIIGMGNALVDILTHVNSDNTITSLGFERGSMNLVDRDAHKKIEEATANAVREMVPGGSAANTIRGLAHLGVKTGYIGKIGNDKTGECFAKELEQYSIEPKLRKSETHTGCCMVMISRDAERTMATYLGAAVELTDDEISIETFTGYDILHIEGYLVQNHALIEGAIKKAKQAGLTISIDMASFNVVEENIDFLHRIIKEYVDIVFANEAEAEAFAKSDTQTALDYIAKMCEIAVVKVGEKGALIKCKGEQFHTPAIDADVRDTTGAGDLFATGFLYGLSKGASIEKCAEAGSIVAARVIAHIGTAIPESEWRQIEKELYFI